ncbi:hypothetical protein LOD99_6848 [Oopsacas minuta]|uniref:IPT/TIG domain-containing protein n=1 Tax=Oopsacas minuta TaxID=111878 RepID=A0AAV7JKT9_9METZ|nr:hypothetical protein LOD99_6848 [Oopsacas minuta]
MSELLKRTTPSPTNQLPIKIQVNCTVISARINSQLITGKKDHSWSVVFGPKKSQFQTQVSAEPTEPRWHDQATLKCHYTDTFQFKLKDKKQTVAKHETAIPNIPRVKTPITYQLSGKQGVIADLMVSCWVSGYIPPSQSQSSSRTSEVLTKLHTLPRKHPSLKRPCHLPADGWDPPPSPLLRTSGSLSNAHSESNIASRKRSGLIWDSGDKLDSPTPQTPLGYRGDSSSSLSSCPDRSSMSSLTESLRSQPAYTTPNRIPTPHVTAVYPRVLSLDRNTRVYVTGEHLCQTQDDILELKIGDISCTEYIESVSCSEIQLTIPALIYMPDHKGHLFLHTRQGTCEAKNIPISFQQGVTEIQYSRISVNSDLRDSPASSTDDLKVKSFPETVPSSHARYSMISDQLMPPEVTGLGPRQATLRGDVQITLRGNYLGISRDDVIRVGVAGVDCTHSLEYFSSYKIVVTCPAVPFPCSGPVVVETSSGGIGLSGMHFSFVDEDTLGTKEYLAGKSPNRPSVKKMSTHKEEQLIKLNQELQSSNSQLKVINKEHTDEIKRLQEYIDKLVARIMIQNPELLLADT